MTNNDEPPKELVDQLTLEVIEAAGSKIDPNLLITLAIKAGYRAAMGAPKATAIDRRTAAKMRTLKTSGLTVAEIAKVYGAAAADVRVALRSK